MEWNWEPWEDHGEEEREHVAFKGMAEKRVRGFKRWQVKDEARSWALRLERLDEESWPALLLKRQEEVKRAARAPASSVVGKRLRVLLGR